MNTLLIFFALPIATIILASVLETILNNPFAVAAVAFAIYLIVTFAAFDETFLIATIVYTILALISALITRAVRNSIADNDNDSNNCSLNTLENTNSLTNNCRCNCRRRNLL